MEDNRVVLITGAKGGLGTFVTEAFLAAGDTVVGTSKSIQESDFYHSRFVAMASDLTDAASAARLVDCVIQRFQRIDVLVHVMGGFSGGKPIAETDDATWDRMMNLNLRSGFNIFRAVIPRMRAAGQGRIVAIASRAAVEAPANIAAYGASKAALVSLVRAAALENKDRSLTVNAILPSTIDTDANRKADPTADFSRWVAPASIADLVVFLSSEAAGQITGATIPIYGKEA
jgi:NAD(P)-dependent dehydrogenase (short-subunit alcohol dehydrogenase family)